jgi:hypothetical protein
MTHYSQPESEFLYAETYPDMVEFHKPWDCCVRVGQGRGGISSDGKPLLSEGFGLCAALIIKNVQTSESSLFHIDEWNLSERQTPVVEQMIHNYIGGLSLSDEERERLLCLASGASRYWNLKNFSNKPYTMLETTDFRNRMRELYVDGTIKVCFVRGGVSRDIDSIVMRELLNNFGITNSTNILVDTSNVHWGVLYKPQESTIFVDARKDKKLLTFSF